MKNVLLTFFIICSTNLYSQDGFDVIQRAEKKIENGKYEKALKLLEKADSMNYGFCGNTWIEAREAISFNRFKIFDAKSEYLQAANTLNSINLNYSENIDSLKMSYFIKAVGKKIIKHEVDSCINLISSIDSIDFILGFELKVLFSNQPFQLSYDTFRTVRRDTFIQIESNKDILPLERFKNSLRRQPFYLLLE